MQAFRDKLILAYLNDLLEVDDFVYLYDTNQSKSLFPYWKFDEFHLENLDNVECRAEFRFRKTDIPILLNILNIPERIVCCQRTTCSGLEGLCILLKRLACPCRYTDMVSMLGRNPTEICLIFNTVLNFVYITHHHHLESWQQPFLSPESLADYADSIHVHGSPIRNCFAFVDGTVLFEKLQGQKSKNNV